MFKTRFGYLLALLLTVLSAAISVMAQCKVVGGPHCILTPVDSVTGCGACNFSLGDRWRQYVTNEEVIGAKFTTSSMVTITELNYRITTPSGAILAEITQVIDKPVSSQRQVVVLSEEARTVFKRYAKNNNLLTINVKTAGERQEHFRVQLGVIKHQGL